MRGNNLFFLFFSTKVFLPYDLSQGSLYEETWQKGEPCSLFLSFQMLTLNNKS